MKSFTTTLKILGGTTFPSNLRSLWSARYSRQCVTENSKVGDVIDEAECDILSLLDSAIDTACVVHGPQFKRKRFALLLSYLGHNYHGMQYNPDIPTIEGELLKALYSANCIETPVGDDDLQLQRVSRTDKGVSALRQVVSMRLPPDTNIEEINQHLPSDIRIIAAKRVTGPFNLQKICCSRTYSYVTPTFAFCPHYQDPECIYSYRIDVDSMYKIQDLLNVYLGRHRFHNYTSQRDMMDPRSFRTITEFYCSDPYLVGETEVIELNVTGGSFMLHHIRKMVGMVIAIMRGKSPEWILQETFSSPKLPTPLAPGLGLFLERPNFDWYNMKTEENRLDWKEHNHDINSFKMNTVVPFIVNFERQHCIMMDFLSALRKHSFRDNRILKPELEEIEINEEIEKINEEIEKINALIENNEDKIIS